MNMCMFEVNLGVCDLIVVDYIYGLMKLLVKILWKVSI